MGISGRIKPGWKGCEDQLVGRSGLYGLNSWLVGAEKTRKAKPESSAFFCPGKGIIMSPIISL
jgi:hypothetical protein